MAKDTLHVVPHDNGWSVKREGNERASSTHATQKEAIDSAHALARDGDDIVVHRPDGTIRERTTRTATGGNGNGQTRTALEPHDVLSVGSRVSWQAILAGVAVAATTYIGLTLLAIAIGVSTVDTVQSRTFAIGAAVVGIIILLASLFLGGCVATRLSTRETPGEATIHGVLVWAGLFFAALLAGINLGGSVGMMSQVAQVPRVEAAAPAPATLTPEQQQRRDAMLARGEQLMSEMNPATVAWWAFGGMALSVLAAIGGALVGCGPELVFRRVVRTEPEARPDTRVTGVQPA